MAVAGVLLLGFIQTAYPQVFMIASPLVVWSLASLWRNRPAGCQLRLVEGEWFMATRKDAQLRPVELEAVLLPFLVQLHSRPRIEGTNWSCVLFPDNLSDEDWRALRRNLQLQGGG